jgi:hypothetical protein
MKALLLAAARGIAALRVLRLGFRPGRVDLISVPLGQCFDPPDCGGRHSAYAYQCPLVRERIETPSGHVIYRMRRVCR